MFKHTFAVCYNGKRRRIVVFDKIRQTSRRDEVTKVSNYLTTQQWRRLQKRSKRYEKDIEYSIVGLPVLDICRCLDGLRYKIRHKNNNRNRALRRGRLRTCLA